MELKPCPFCGGNAVLVKNEHPRLLRPIKNRLCHIECYNCNVMMGYDTDYGGQFDTDEEAIETWNKRI
jgi:Lar family restriction alleviation protein